MTTATATTTKTTTTKKTAATTATATAKTTKKKNITYTVFFYIILIVLIILLIIFIIYGIAFLFEKSLLRGSTPVYLTKSGFITTGKGYEPVLYLRYIDGDTLKFQQDVDYATKFTKMQYGDNKNDFIITFEGNEYTRVLYVHKKKCHVTLASGINHEFGSCPVLDSEQLDKANINSNHLFQFKGSDELLYIKSSSITSPYLYIYSNKTAYPFKGSKKSGWGNSLPLQNSKKNNNNNNS